MDSIMSLWQRWHANAESDSPAAMQTEEEQQEVRAMRASMQRLPADIQPQPVSQPTGVCHVCYIEDYTDDNLLLEVSSQP